MSSNNIIFSHRPKAGVSAGAFNEEGKLFVAFAFTNDGFSCNGIKHADRLDSFSRAVARAIITGRIENLRTPSGQFVADPGSSVFREQPTETAFGLVFETDMPARVFMARFRETFKPTVDESDDFMSIVIDFEGVETRGTLMASEKFDRVNTLANEVVTNASVSL